MKKNLIIITSIIVSGLIIAGAAYVWFFVGSTPTEVTSGNQDSPFMDIGDRPFGEVPTRPDATQPTQEIERPALTRLWRVTQTPVAASVIWSEDDEEAPNYYVRYLERGTGHLYEQNVFTRRATKLTNTTVPRIQYATWLSDENHLVLQYLNTSLERVETYLGTVSQKDPDANLQTDELKENAYQLGGQFLEQNIHSITGSPIGNAVLYNVPAEEGSLLRIRTESGGLSTLKRSPHNRLQVAWPAASTIALTTNASANIPGFHYFVNENGGNERIILYSDKALTALTNSDLSRTVFFTIQDNLPLLFLQETGSLDSVVQPFATLPEKCVWSSTQVEIIYCAVPSDIPRTNFPDSWYQGKLAFNDSLWAINTETLTTRLLASQIDFQNFGAADGMDAYRFTIDPSGRYISFINRRDFSLWAMEVPPLESGATLPESN